MDSTASVPQFTPGNCNEITGSTVNSRDFCSMCKLNQNRPGQRTCYQCHRAYQRAHRKRFVDLSQEERRRASCRSKLHMRIRRGLMTKPDYCELCGFSCSPQGHHHDYDKPYEVVWVCHPCHRKIHRSPVRHYSVVLAILRDKELHAA